MIIYKVNRDGQKLTVSGETAKNLNGNRAGYYPVETLL